MEVLRSLQNHVLHCVGAMGTRMFDDRETSSNERPRALPNWETLGAKVQRAALVAAAIHLAEVASEGKSTGLTSDRRFESEGGQRS